MTCSPFRESLSARLDGETGDLPTRWVDDHLDSCAACRGWLEAASEATRRARVAPAAAVPDLTMAVLQRLPEAVAVRRGPRLWVQSALRLALMAVGAGQAALAFPALASGADSMSAPLHVAHESGAWNGALAIAFLVVAVLPRLAGGALPLLGSFTAVLAFVTVRDLAAGHVHLDRAAGHLLLLAGTVLVAVLAWRGRTHRPSGLTAPGRWRVRSTTRPRSTALPTGAAADLPVGHRLRT